MKIERPAGIVSILKTSFPILVELSAQIVMWTIETNLVSRISRGAMARYYPGVGATGVDAFTAVGNVIQIIILTCTVALIFIFGSTIVINRLLGAGKRDEANHVLGQSIFTTMFAAVLVGFAWYFLAPFLFKVVLGTSRPVTAVALDYLRTIAPFSPFIIMNFVATGIVRGSGDTHLSMITSLLVNFLHLVLAIMLIFGISGFPALGVRGSALAAGLAHTTGFLWTYSVILRGRSVLSFSWRDLGSIRRPTIMRIVRTGAPITLEQLVWMTGMTIIIGFSHRLGEAAAAAHIVALTLQRLFSVFYQSLGIATLTFVGRRFGAGDYGESRRIAMLFTWITGAFVLCISGAVFLEARAIALLFTSEPDVVSLAVKVLKVVAVIQIPKALSYVYTFSLRGIGENRFPLYLSLAGVVVIELIVGFNLAFTLGFSLIGIWAAAGIDESCKLVLAARRFDRRLRRLSLSTGG